MCVMILYMEDLGALLKTMNPDEVRIKAESGDVQAQYHLGMMYGQGINTRPDMNQAFHWMLKAAQGGIVFAMNNIGYLLQHGLGCEQDQKAAFNWYLKAADMGLPPALMNVYHCYSNGVGVAKDPALAIRYLEKAANTNFPEAKVALGDYYWEHENNSEKMLYWYNKAIEEDHSAMAMFALACNYSRGIGVKLDMKKADTLLKKSADNGYGDAAMILAQQYERKGNYEKAKNYYTIAAQAGNRNAMAILIDQYQ